MRSRPWLVLFATMTAPIAICACGDDGPLSPERASDREKEPEVEEPRLSHVPEPPDLGDGAAIPIPDANEGTAWVTVAEVPERLYVHLVVEGGITFQANPEWCGDNPTPPAPLDGETAGPGGASDGFWNVEARVVGGGRTVRLGLREDPDDRLRSEFLGHVRAGRIQVRRRGGGGGCSVIQGNEVVEAHELYLLSGSQHARADAIVPIQVHGTPTTVQEGDSVTFRMTSPLPFTDPGWYWIRGDTMPRPEGRPLFPNVCLDAGDVCKIQIVKSGRMYGTGRLKGWAAAEGVSPIIRATEEPPDTLAVTLSASPGEVEPVVDRAFDAVAQTWSDPDTGFRVNDLIDLRVQASWQPSGRPAEELAIRFRVEPRDGSGGHPHGTRPPGTFFRVEDRPTPADQKKGVTGSKLTIVTDDQGRAEAVYRTSGVSGLEVVRVHAEAEGDEDGDEEEIRIRVEGLEDVARSGDAYRFEGASNSHHPVENYLAPGVIEVMEGIWRAYREKHEMDPEGYPLTGERFTVTGASVRWGGLFDIGRNWRNPHRTHRLGRDVDFDNAGAETMPKSVRHICARAAFQLEGVATFCEFEKDHFHAYVGRTFYHR